MKIQSILIFVCLSIVGSSHEKSNLSQAFGEEFAKRTTSSSPLKNTKRVRGFLFNKNLPLAILPNNKIRPLKKGALQGKKIIISPGHGYFNRPGYWTTQRGVTQNLIEDIHTNEIVMDYLIPCLVRAGATVVSCRERSRQSKEIILTTESISGYKEIGKWNSLQNTKSRYPARQTTSFFAKAIFTPKIQSKGMYPLYIYFSPSFQSSKNTLIQVHHTGGITNLRIDQSQNENRWKFLGEFYFESGESGYVTISNPSSSLDSQVVVNAMRFGGGIGKSGQPRWKEGARQWIPYTGAPLGHFGEVAIRGKYADWQKGDVFISIHTNGGGGTGTSSFIHSYDPSPGSEFFRTQVHNTLVRDMRALVNPNWVDRGKQKANFGELRNTKTMAALLIELAFHDRKEDAKVLQNGYARYIIGRALYKGISRYLAPSKKISPLSPDHFFAKNLGHGRVKLSWKSRKDTLESTATSNGYVIYTSKNGYGFDNGQKTYGTTKILGNLTLGALYFFKVTSWNSGGESLDSETLAVRVIPKGSTAKILIVNGFDRSLNSTSKLYQKNTRNYTIQHGMAIGKSGYFFDSISNEALESGKVSLEDYKIVDWILGMESTKDKTFSTKEQKLLQKYLTKGGSLFVSGSEIAWDLGAKGKEVDQRFLKNFLHIRYIQDNAKTYSVSSLPNTIFSSIPKLNLGNGTKGFYNVAYPDVIAPENGAKACLHYNKDQQVGGIQYKGTYKLVLLAFPFEAIYGEKNRGKVMKDAIDFLR